MVEFFKKNIIFTVMIIVLMVGSAMYIFDYTRANNFEIEVLAINPSMPIADGETPVSVQVQLTKNGKPVSEHYLFMIPIDGGTMNENRIQTDEDGIANFIYYPYRATVLTPARKVTIRVYDEDNSVFVVVNTRKDFHINLKGA